MMLATHLSYLSLCPGRGLLHSGHDAFVSIHLVMHSSQNRCAQFKDRHGLRNISWQIPHLNSCIKSSPPPIALSVLHSSLSFSSALVFLGVFAVVRGLLLSMLGLRSEEPGLVCWGVCLVLPVPPHPALARASATCLSPHPRTPATTRAPSTARSSRTGGSSSPTVVLSRHLVFPCPFPYQLAVLCI